MLMVLLNKSDYAPEITSIKNDYVTNTTHISDEVRKIDDKTKKNASDILAFESRLKQKEDVADESQREDSFTRGFYYYLQQSYLVYECRDYSFRKNNNDFLTNWKSTGYDNLLVNSNLNTIATEKGVLPKLKKDRIFSVRFFGNYFVQNKLLNISNSVCSISIYIFYELDSISNTRNTDYSNALFGAIKSTKHTDSSKNKYEGYGICFDEGDLFSEGNINNGRNVLIFGVHESSITHTTNKANNIYVLGKNFVQGINGTTLYAEKVSKTNFTVSDKKFVLSLHYNSDNSYLFINGRQELKFKAKEYDLLGEKLCVGNSNDNWTTLNSRKTGLYGHVYDFVVHYQGIAHVKKDYDMHRYLMIKHGIN